MLNRNIRAQTYCSFFIIFLLLISCTTTQERQLEQASRQYKAHRDYASLAVIAKHLTKGMVQSKVTDWLGEPDYSPIAGQYYYSSDRYETVLFGKQEMQIPVGLVIDYLDEQGELTEQVQSFWLGHIGE